MQQPLPQQVRRRRCTTETFVTRISRKTSATNFKIVGVALQRQQVAEGAAEEEDVATALRMQTDSQTEAAATLVC